MTLQNAAKLCKIRTPRATRNQVKHRLQKTKLRLLKGISVNSLHDTLSTVNLQSSLEAEADAKRQFKMIDAWLREYERRNRDWPTLAKMCSEVKVKGLWKHGGYKDWNHWVLDAAPVCARTHPFALDEPGSA